MAFYFNDTLPKSSLDIMVLTLGIFYIETDEEEGSGSSSRNSAVNQEEGMLPVCLNEPLSTTVGG